MKSASVSLLVVVLLGVVAVAHSGCGVTKDGDDSGSTNAATTDAGNTQQSSSSGTVNTDAGLPDGGNQARSVVKLHVPSGFTGTTRKLMIVTSMTRPMFGPPAAKLLEQSNPVFAPEETKEFNIDTSRINGTFYLVAVLYMENGGSYAPQSGVDYQAYSADKITFTGDVTDHGTMNLELAN